METNAEDVDTLQQPDKYEGNDTDSKINNPSNSQTCDESEEMEIDNVTHKEENKQLDSEDDEIKFKKPRTHDCESHENEDKVESNSESNRNNLDEETEDRIWATLYGQCIGDAIGLLTEFMTVEDAKKHYGMHSNLEFQHKINDRHRMKWKTGDWTDDSDQMILIMESLIKDQGKTVPTTFAVELKGWTRNGLTELKDKGGYGIGGLTREVISKEYFTSQPFKASASVWEKSGRKSAPNGGLMRASITGIHEFWDTPTVIKNAVCMCKVTHSDPRCHASVAALCNAISMMLKKEHYRKGNIDIEYIIQKSYQEGCKYLQDEPKSIEEFGFYVNCKEIRALKLDEKSSIGYTFKCLGAAFWALRQNDFRKAIQEITMNAGDADTNGAVAGALLACKLGTKCLPYSWLNELHYKKWLDKKIKRYLDLLATMFTKRHIQTVTSNRSTDPQEHENNGESTSDEHGAATQQAKNDLMCEKKYRAPDDQIYATIYGQCIGDSLSLATEETVKKTCKDNHMVLGDNTEYTDQIMLIMEMLEENGGEVEGVLFALKLDDWKDRGFLKLRDGIENGIDEFERKIIENPSFVQDSKKIALSAWKETEGKPAHKGAVLRTSVLGVHEYWNLDSVILNAIEICEITHADPRCKASVVAVSVAISLMLKRDERHFSNGEFLERKIITDSYREAKRCLEHDERMVNELFNILFCFDLNCLQKGKRDFTFDAVGAGFWAFKQNDFEDAIERVISKGGDAAVAGALLGCKLGLSGIKKEWIYGLNHKKDLDENIERYLRVLDGMLEKHLETTAKIV